MKRTIVTSGVVYFLMTLAGSNVLADTAATIFTLPNGTGVTYDNASGAYPVVTAILSEPGTVNGRTYSYWSFLAEDASGSLDIYASSTSLSGFGYVPTVGDALTVSGTYTPYNQIPEIGSLSSITAISTGNSIPAVGLSTISALNQATLPQNIAGRLWTLNNVTISGISGTFGTGNVTGSVSDGVDSMTFYYWATSYSVANENLFGTEIPTGPVNMTGFISVYHNTTTDTYNPEFVPISIAAVPEPTILSLLGGAGLLALVIRRRRQ